VSAGTLAVIAAACRDHERLRFDYRRHDGMQSVRVVEPYRLVNWGRRWYLVAFDTDRADWRNFRADRIEPRTPAGPRFTPRDLPGDIVARVTRGVSTAAWRYRAEVTVHAPAELVAERINPLAGTVEAVGDDVCVLSTGAAAVETLAVYLGLLAVRFAFTVSGPPELVDLLRTLAKRYQSATPEPTC
jgi:predicted DNA-binding transcriptional regulator YafY